MRLFISHANADVNLAKLLRITLEERSEELKCFLLADDSFPGEVWEDRIRAAAADCDAILSIVTPRYLGRPWFIAEWSVFWFQEKPSYLLLEGVELDALFEPMRRRQVAKLGDRRAMGRLLAALGLDSGDDPVEVAASDLVDSLRKALAQQAKSTRDESIRKLKTSLERNTSNVDRAVVRVIVEAGDLERITEAAAESDNSVALRQLATHLLGEGQPGAAGQVAARITNNAERRTVGVAGLDRLKSNPADDEARQVVLAIYESVRDPQRRDLRSAAEARGVAVEWPEVAPSA
jgi:hypothetical protein